MAKGEYSKLRYHADALRADRNTLANAPLTLRQQRKLESSIKYHQENLKVIRAKIRSKKTKIETDIGKIDKPSQK